MYFLIDTHSELVWLASMLNKYPFSQLTHENIFGCESYVQITQLLNFF